MVSKYYYKVQLVKHKDTEVEVLFEEFFSPSLNYVSQDMVIDNGYHDLIDLPDDLPTGEDIIMLIEFSAQSTVSFEGEHDVDFNVISMEWESKGPHLSTDYLTLDT